MESVERPALDFRLLGATEVWHGETPLSLRRGTLRVLLATLVMEANQTVSFDRLIERLWAERPPRTARNNLQVYAKRWRQALGDAPGATAVLTTEPDGY